MTNSIELDKSAQKGKSSRKGVDTSQLTKGDKSEEKPPLPKEMKVSKLKKPADKPADESLVVSNPPQSANPKLLKFSLPLPQNPADPLAQTFNFNPDMNGIPPFAPKFCNIHMERCIFFCETCDQAICWGRSRKRVPGRRSRLFSLTRGPGALHRSYRYKGAQCLFR